MIWAVFQINNALIVGRVARAHCLHHDAMLAVRTHAERAQKPLLLAFSGGRLAMHKNRVEITAGRVQAIREISSDSERVETFDANNSPHHFFVEQVADNTRWCLWDGSDYENARTIAKELANETGLEIANLGGLRIV